MTHYESEQYRKILNWKREKPSVVSKAVGFVFRPVTMLVQQVIPQKVIEGVLVTCNSMAVKITDSDDILRDAKVSNIEELQHKDLYLSDKLANDVRKWAMVAAGAEGAVAGVTGALGLVADVPALITMSFRVIHKIGLCYGYKCQTEVDKQFVMGILAAAGSNTIQEKIASIATLKQINGTLASNTLKMLSVKAVENKFSVEAAIITIRNLAKELGINISQRKASQAVPFIGAGLGAAINAAFLNDVAWAAIRAFQERWLMENQRIAIEDKR